MHCPFCRDSETRVVDSRDTENGAAIRRRRECSSCGQRFTTFERMESTALVVTKRDGRRVPFDRAKVVAGVLAAAKNRPVDAEQAESLAAEVEEAVRLEGHEVTTQEIGVAVLDRLRRLDEVAYLRFASVYKGFEDAGDFQREAGLLTKATAPKRRRGGG